MAGHRGDGTELARVPRQLVVVPPSPGGVQPVLVVNEVEPGRQQGRVVNNIGQVPANVPIAVPAPVTGGGTDVPDLVIRCWIRY